MRILIVEDEPKLARLLARGLGEEGHPADVAATGEEALWMAGAAAYDVIVLDVMLPGLDGFAVCRTLREREVWTPVLMLTARDALEDRIQGLLARQHTAQRRKQHSIGRPKPRTRELPLQHLQPVAQNENLNLFRTLRPHAQDDQLEQAPQRPVNQREDDPQ